MAKLKIVLEKSLIGCSETQRKTAQALGLKKRGSSVVQEDTPSIRGNVRKLGHLISVEEIEA